ncbi:uncharacterized protein LOC142984213 [Anticarsia gemmatalis]|uniref:uncharacterized protein LOC142984213 n=1 Tax=Anticarsia gemmatalis TaxID=129554 RepID=UPI003F766C0C
MFGRIIILLYFSSLICSNRSDSTLPVTWSNFSAVTQPEMFPELALQEKRILNQSLFGMVQRFLNDYVHKNTTMPAITSTPDANKEYRQTDEMSASEPGTKHKKPQVKLAPKIVMKTKTTSRFDMFEAAVNNFERDSLSDTDFEGIQSPGMKVTRFDSSTEDERKSNKNRKKDLEPLLDSSEVERKLEKHNKKYYEKLAREKRKQKNLTKSNTEKRKKHKEKYKYKSDKRSAESTEDVGSKSKFKKQKGRKTSESTKHEKSLQLRSESVESFLFVDDLNIIHEKQAPKTSHTGNDDEDYKRKNIPKLKIKRIKQKSKPKVSEDSTELTSAKTLPVIDMSENIETLSYIPEKPKAKSEKRKHKIKHDPEPETIATELIETTTKRSKKKVTLEPQTFTEANTTSQATTVTIKVTNDEKKLKNEIKKNTNVAVSVVTQSGVNKKDGLTLKQVPSLLLTAPNKTHNNDSELKMIGREGQDAESDDEEDFSRAEIFLSDPDEGSEETDKHETKHKALRYKSRSRKSVLKCIGKKALKLCKKSCRNAYKNVCKRMRCTTGSRKDLGKQCRKSCQRTFRYSKYSAERWQSSESSSSFSD